MRAADSVKLVGIGVASGFLSALFGVGGGIVIVPLLAALLAFEPRRAAATSLAAILISSVAGSVTYALHGDVKPGAAALVGIPAVVGVLSGVALQQRLAQRTLTLGFALVLAGAGVRLLV